jgi:hypothetical protein
VNQYLTFWFGLLLAIPLSLIANLLTPNVRRLLVRWSEKRRLLLEKKLTEEDEKIQGILSDRFQFYRYLLLLIYLHLTLLILFFLAFWLLSTLPYIVEFVASFTKQPYDAKALSQLIAISHVLHTVIAILFTCVFLLMLQKTFKFTQKVIGKSLEKI